MDTQMKSADEQMESLEKSLEEKWVVVFSPYHFKCFLWEDWSIFVAFLVSQHLYYLHVIIDTVFT